MINCSINLSQKELGPWQPNQTNILHCCQSRDASIEGKDQDWSYYVIQLFFIDSDWPSFKWAYLQLTHLSLMISQISILSQSSFFTLLHCTAKMFVKTFQKPLWLYWNLEKEKLCSSVKVNVGTNFNFNWKFTKIVF